MPSITAFPERFSCNGDGDPELAAASWCKRIYGRDKRGATVLGLTVCGNSTAVDKGSGDPTVGSAREPLV
jgi:hypothetical protein